MGRLVSFMSSFHLYFYICCRECFTRREHCHIRWGQFTEIHPFYLMSNSGLFCSGREEKKSSQRAIQLPHTRWGTLCHWQSLVWGAWLVWFWPLGMGSGELWVVLQSLDVWRSVSLGSLLSGLSCLPRSFLQQLSQRQPRKQVWRSTNNIEELQAGHWDLVWWRV